MPRKPRNPEFGRRLTAAKGGWEARHYPAKLPDKEIGAKLSPPVTSQAVSRWMAGKEPKALDTIRQLALVLEVDPRWLAFGDHVNHQGGTAVPAIGPYSGPDYAEPRATPASEKPKRRKVR